MDIKPEHKTAYKYLKQNMLFACIWTERLEGGFNSFDYRPFVALKEVNNQGVTAYEGKYIDYCKKLDANGWAIKNTDGSFKKQLVIADVDVYKPLSSFKESGHNRIFVSIDLDEICNLFLEK